MQARTQQVRTRLTFVWMVLEGQLAMGALYLIWRGIFADTQHFIVACAVPLLWPAHSRHASKVAPHAREAPKEHGVLSEEI